MFWFFFSSLKDKKINSISKWVMVHLKKSYFFLFEQILRFPYCKTLKSDIWKQIPLFELNLNLFPLVLFFLINEISFLIFYLQKKFKGRVVCLLVFLLFLIRLLKHFGGKNEIKRKYAMGQQQSNFTDYEIKAGIMNYRLSDYLQLWCMELD